MDIVFDLDGTICFQGKPIAKEISEKLKTLQERGHRVLIASARPIRDIYPVLPGWMRSLDMVGGNGAFVQKNGKVEVVCIDCMDQLREMIDKYRLSYLADSRWDYAYTGPRILYWRM